MNKSDLKDGMMLRLRNNNIYSLLHGYLLELKSDDSYKIIASMEDYDDEFKNCNVSLDDSSVLDVMKVYDKDMNELWESKKEIDWNKVPLGTKVLYSYDNEDWFKGYYLNYLPESTKSHYVLNLNRTSSHSSMYCILIEDKKEEIETDELLDDHQDYCDVIRYTDECTHYSNCSTCRLDYILSNYNITRK